MFSDPYPSAGDLRDLATAHASLAAHGVLAGGAGYDLPTLAAATYGGGWSYRIDRSVGKVGFAADVRSIDDIRHFHAIGWEPEVALAFALSAALEERPIVRR